MARGESAGRVMSISRCVLVGVFVAVVFLAAQLMWIKLGVRASGYPLHHDVLTAGLGGFLGARAATEVFRR